MRQPGAAAERAGPGKPGRPGLWHVIPPRVLDATIAVVLAALGLAGGLGARAQHEHVPLAALPVLVAMGLVLYPRRRFPAAVLGAVAALVITLAVLRTSLEASFLAVLCACYSAAVYGSRRLAIGLLTGSVAALIGVGIPQALGFGEAALQAAAIRVLLAAAGAALFGLLIKGQFAARSSQLAVMAERAEWAAAQRAEEARRATLAERLRIARELHDIVAHHVSVIVIQAQGAQRMVDRDPDRSRQAMADVERTARTALDEMRRLLGLLRPSDPGAGPERADRQARPDRAAGGAAAGGAAAGGAAEGGAAEGGAAERAAADGGEREPPHGLADIEALAARMSAAGLRVTVRTTGEPRPVPEDVGLAGYRIAQEALTNVLKHAGPARALLRLHYGERLELTVTDDGRGAAAGLTGPQPAGAGRGTTGMRERVSMLGGQFTAGPQPGGGFRVHAAIPDPYLPPDQAVPGTPPGESEPT
jgi:signal transduction histidine kinase